MFKPTESQSHDTGAGAALADDDIIDFIGARVFESITIPRTSYKGAMRIVSRKETAELKAAARRHFIEQGLPLDNHAAFGAEEWSNEIAIRMLALAVRNPRDPRLALAPLDEWRELDDDQIDALWLTYRDFRDRIDPVGAGALSEREIAELEVAAKKKDLESTMRFGSRKLALFVMHSLTALPTS